MSENENKDKTQSGKKIIDNCICRNMNMKYVGIDDVEGHEEHGRVFIDELIDFFKNYFNEDNRFTVKECGICDYDLFEALDRVDRRIAYYHCYHGIKISDLKFAALLAYWVIKLKPFRVIGADTIKEFEVNEYFAAYIIFCALAYEGRISSVEYCKDKKYYDKLTYTFRFRNISIDVILVLAETINEWTFDFCEENDEEA